MSEEHEKVSNNISEEYKANYGRVEEYSDNASDKMKEDSKNAQKKMSDDADEIGDSHKKNSEKTLGSWTKVFGTIGKIGISGMKAVTVAGGAAVAGISALSIASLNAAGELEQNMGGSEAVFKDYAESMQKTAKDAYKNMGLSASDYLATANKMGALMQGSGLSIEESADLSAQAMQRAADVASIMGIDVSAAMESVAGAAKGNFTMMDNLGVAMNATTLEAYALSKGITTAYKDMDNATKVQLAMEMFLEKTEYAAGNYAKENETLAGSLTTAKAAWDNFLSGAGDADALADSFANAAMVIADNLLDIVPRLLSTLPEVAVKLAPKLQEVADEIINSISNGMEGDGVTKFLSSLGGVITELAKKVAVLAPKLVKLGVELIKELAESLKGNTSDIVDIGGEIVASLVEGIVEVIPALASVAYDIVTGLLKNIADNSGNIFSSGSEILLELVNGITSKIPELLAMAVDTIITLALALTEPSTLSNIINAGIELIRSLLVGLLDALPELLNAIPEIVANIVAALIESAPEMLNAAVEILGQLAKYLLEEIVLVWTIIPELFNEIVAKFKEMDWTQIGADIINGIWNGLISGWSWLVDGIKGLASDLFGASEDELEVDSPSGKFKYLGEMCVAGWEEGSEDLFNADDVKKDINATLSVVKANTTGIKGVAGNNGYTQNVYVNKEVSTPDELARAIRVESKYGLMGGVAFE